IFSIAGGLCLKKGWGSELNDYRTGYLICMAGYLFAGSTVHFWTAAHAWFFFLLGSGVWMLDVPSRLNRRNDAEEASPDEARNATALSGRGTRPRRHELEAARQKDRASQYSPVRRR